MSKARLVITAVVIEGRSQSAVAREYSVSQGWISRLVTRYRLEGEAAFEPRSRRPHSSPTRLPQTTVDLIVELRNKLRTAGLDSGPHTIAWHLEHHHQLQVSVASISRHLAAAGLVTPTPAKRPKSCTVRGIRPRHRSNSKPIHHTLRRGIMLLIATLGCPDIHATGIRTRAPTRTATISRRHRHRPPILASARVHAPGSWSPPGWRWRWSRQASAQPSR